MKKPSWLRNRLPLAGLVFWIGVAGGATWWFGTEAPEERFEITTFRAGQHDMALISRSTDFMLLQRLRQNNAEWILIRKRMGVVGDPTPKQLLHFSKDSKMLGIGINQQLLEIIYHPSSRKLRLVQWWGKEAMAREQIKHWWKQHGGVAPLQDQTRSSSFWRWQDIQFKEFARNDPSFR